MPHSNVDWLLSTLRTVSPIHVDDFRLFPFMEKVGYCLVSIRYFRQL